MSKKNIVSLTWDFNVGGAGIAATRLNQAITAINNYKVISIDKMYLRDNIATDFNFIIILFCQLNSFISILLSKLYSKQISFLLIPTFIFINKKIRSSRFIHIHLLAGGFISFWDIFLMLKKRNLILIVHDKFILNGWDHIGSFTKWNIQSFLFKKILTSKNIKIVFLSKIYQNDFNLRMRPLKIITYYIPIPFEFDNIEFVKSIDFSSIVIGFAAQDLDDPNKGLNHLLKISKFLTNDFKFHICGKIKNKDILNNCCNYIGSLSHSEMPSFYKRIDILLVLSIHENSPNVIIEAIANNTIVIAYDVGGISELLNEIFLVKYGDNTGIINKLLDLKYNYKYYLEAFNIQKKNLITSRSPLEVISKFNSLID